MHRYREFGLMSEADETFRRAFRDGFRRAGLPHARLTEALAWYRDHAPGGVDEAKHVDTFGRFATENGWSPEDRDRALDIYRSIRDGGPAAVMEAAPSPDQDRSMVARAEDLMRSDPTRYWGDAALQDAVFEAQERLAVSPPMPSGSGNAADRNIAADRARVGEVEAMLRDPAGARRYWNDEAVRVGYAQALERLAGAAEPQTPAAPSFAATAAAPQALAINPTPSIT